MFKYLFGSTLLRVAITGLNTALPLLAVHVYDDVGVGGLLVLAAVGASFITAPIVGVLLDRVGIPKVIILGAGVVVSIGLLTTAFLGTVAIWVVLPVLVLVGGVGPAFQGGLSSFVSDGISPEVKAYSIDTISYNLSSVLGPAIASVAVLVASPREAIYTLFVASVTGTAIIAGFPIVPRNRKDLSFVRTLARGLIHIGRHRPLRLVVVTGGTTQFAAGALPIILVILAADILAKADLGAFLMTMYALGALIGGLLSNAVLKVIAPPKMLFSGFIVVGVMLSGVLLSSDLWWISTCLAFAGIATAPCLAAMLLMRKSESPILVRSQVFTVSAGFRSSLGAMGAGAAGAAANLNSGYLILISAGIWIGSGLVMLGYPNDEALGL